MESVKKNTFFVIAVLFLNFFYPPLNYNMFWQQLLKNIWEEVSRRFNCSWLEVLQFRENHVGTPENAAKGLVYHFHQRQYEEQQQQQLAAYHQGAALDTYGTAARFHQPVAGCMYGQVQPLHPVPHMGYFNCSPYPAGPAHTCTLPPQPRYAGVISPQQALPPTMTYPVPAVVHPAYHHISGLHHPVLKSQDLYPTNGHRPHHHYSAPTVVNPVPLQNGYSVSAHLPSAPPPPVQNFSCPVPTGQLIELDVGVPPNSSSSETQHTYSATDSASSVLIPRAVHHGSSQHPAATLRKNIEREHDNHRQGVQHPHPHSYSTSLEIVESQPLTSGKAKEDGTGTYESWDYVFRNLESQGYSKDLGARPDILSPSPERMAANSILHKNHLEDVRNSRHHQSAVKDLEETLMELRLEEFHKALPIERRPLKINEALQKIRMETDGETCQGPLGKIPSNVDAVDGSRSVYDNMSSPPKDNPERERPVITALASIKSNGSISAVNNKESARTLPRDTRRYVEESQRSSQAGTHYSSTTLNPKHLQDVPNHYQLVASISDSLPSERNVAVRDSTSKVRIEERQGSIVDMPFGHCHESSEVSEKNKWECVTCTFLNVPSRDICEMCGKSKVRGPEIRPLTSGGRECPHCTLVNEKGVGTCAACGNSLKDSPTYI